ncbi:hypothetical protein J7I93_07900 [Bacillus sp. ISL-47]|uniref:hypothetical protein n=1 Tax=Bacillus sp. ISL-47 TaxID=2819130 RepID=UPI001BE7721E|nr:hypothetical protein [Bacillus sp. ISL-47]MBT2688102.1 hypothetical protein [Bacillus sp. ISL-47]MBT2707640.1 hypothetical protein [Pseudomonas sp. ISL-84]
MRDPTGEAEEALSRGKQAPAVEINGHYFQAKQQFMRKQPISFMSAFRKEE